MAPEADMAPLGCCSAGPASDGTSRRGPPRRQHVRLGSAAAARRHVVGLLTRRRRGAGGASTRRRPRRPKQGGRDRRRRHGNRHREASWRLPRRPRDETRHPAAHALDLGISGSTRAGAKGANALCQQNAADARGGCGRAGGTGRRRWRAQRATAGFRFRRGSV